MADFENAACIFLEIKDNMPREIGQNLTTMLQKANLFLQ